MKHHPPQYTPPLPLRRTTSIANVGFGILNKIVLTYEEAWWKSEKPASWFAILPSTIADEKDGYALPQESIPKTKAEAEWLLKYNGLFFQDYTTITGKNTLVCFLGPPTGFAQELLSDDYVVDVIHQRVVESILPASKRHTAAPPTSTFVTRWNSEPFSRGSYSYFSSASKDRMEGGPSDMLELARPLWDGRLGFAGEHTHVNW
jgi:hypothetical protein